jgi:hypothetical protein
MKSEQDPDRPSTVTPDEHLVEVLERIFRGLVVTMDDDPVEAYAKKRIAGLLRTRGQRHGLALVTTPEGSLFARLRSEPVAEVGRWKRDDLYARRRV